MKLSLVVQTPGSNQGKVLEIKLSPFVVGRDPSCHLRPASPMISKRHCALLQRDGKVFLRDFDSTNGTFVNNEPVKGEIELHHGDQLKIGPLMFEVRIEASAPVNRPVVSRKPATKPAAQANTPAWSVDQKASSRPAVARKPAGAASAVATNTQTDAPAAQADTQTETSAEGGVTSNDDDIAAMLLSLGDDSREGPFGGGSEVPEDSSVHAEPPLPDLAAQPAKEHERAKLATPANPSQAADSILDKYRRSGLSLPVVREE
jgi:predicted component of type VI protein secretion system